MADNPLKVLMVEDSETDVEILKYYLHKNNINLQLQVISTGEEALNFMLQDAPDNKKEFPNLILLDINLPGISGLEVLKQLKENITTKHIPVLMLTNSTEEEDIIKSYGNHASCYLPKPFDPTSLQNLVMHLEKFWFTTAILPKRSS